jgi:hypothetical protein
MLIAAVVVLVEVLVVLIQPWMAEFARGMRDSFVAGFNSTQR